MTFVNLLGYDNKENPDPFNGFLQPNDVALSLRITAKEDGVVDGTSNLFKCAMWAEAGETVDAKFAVYIFNSGSGNLDKVVESSVISGIDDTPDQIQSIVIPTFSFSKNDVLHLFMFGTSYASGNPTAGSGSGYYMLYRNPAISGDTEETQAQGTGLTFPTFPSTILDSNMTKYDTSEIISLQFNQVVPNTGKIQGLSNIQGLFSIQF